MAAFDIDGVFWDPSTPESYVAGRLQFDVADGGKLDLIGLLSGVRGPPSGDDCPEVIFGVAGNAKYTLRGCLPTHYTASMPGIEREAYRISEIYEGVHLDSQVAPEFVSLRIHTRYLSDWVARTGISAAMVENSLDDYQIKYAPPPTESTQIDTGTIEIGHGWKSSGDHFSSAGIEHSTFIKLKFNAPRAISDIFSTVLALQDLVTLGMDSTSVTTAVYLEHAEHTRESFGGSTVHEKIELMAPWLGADVPGSTTRARPDDILFAYSDFGGITGVASWLEVRAKFNLTVNSLLSHRYMPKMYGENLLQNAVFAAESFDRARFVNRVQPRSDFRERRDRILAACPDERDWLKGILQYANEPRLLDRLLRLVDYAGNRFENLVQDIDGWAQLVKDTRNRLVHSEGGGDSPDSLDLFLLSESVYFLVVLCLLKECGIDDAALDGEFENRRYCQLREQLQEHLEY